MFRFFVSANDILTGSINLDTEISKHIKTLRLRPDERFIVCDGECTDYICTLGNPDDCTKASILSSSQSCGEPTVLCTVFIAYSKGDRLDYAVQKSVELGVREIFLFKSERCVAVPKDIPKKITRLQRIALETAKLCDRGIIPNVSDAGDFTSAINKAESISSLTLFLYENEDDLHLKNVLQQHFTQESNLSDISKEHISLITGPEGGFAQHEVEYVRSKDIPVVSLGPRVLRSETAPVAALAAVMYQTDNM